MIRGWDTTRRCAGRPVVRVWLTPRGNGDEDGGWVAWAREGCLLCPDLREWYVVFITEGAACATLQITSVLCPTVGLRLGAQSRLVCLVHVLLHVLKLEALKASRTVASVWG
jgi:hypothetical protein